ncbi:hypothetical protein SNEBB_006490 [Seison nebaliae]|nr:hypothetical protein SNEBB_006490 [Seison nebaliae]
MVYRLKNDEELKIPQHVIGIVEYGDSDIEQVKEKIEEKKTNLDRSFSDMCIYQLEKLNEHFDGEELPKCLRINRKNRSFNHSKYLSTSSLSLNETMPLPIVNRMNLKKL